MSPIWLAANGGNGLLRPLLADDDIRLDRIKAGSWLDDAALTVTAATRPVLLHVSQGVAWPRTNRWLAKQIARTKWLRTPWVSAHLELGSSLLNYHWPRFPLVPRSWARRWAVSTLQRWAAHSPVRVLVENMPRSHPAGHPYLVDPTFITQVVTDANCYFLLDLAHARVTAAMRRQAVRDYIQELPLDRLVEIHVSGPRQAQNNDHWVDAHLVDAHQSMQEDDYDLLEWVLNLARPLAVSLEYWRDGALLKEQLLCLRQILNKFG